jgi:hypothetical protein
MTRQWRRPAGMAEPSMCGAAAGRSGRHTVCASRVGMILLVAALAGVTGCSSKGGFLETTAGASQSAAAPSATAIPQPTDTPTPRPTPTHTPRPTPPPRFGAPTAGQYVYDTAKQMSTASAKKVNDAAVAFAKKHSCHIWFYTEQVKLADQVTGDNAQSDAEELLREWGGSCDIVFLYMTDARDTWYAWGSDSTGVYGFPSGFWDQVKAAVQPYFKKSDIAGGFNAVIAQFGKLLDANS